MNKNLKYGCFLLILIFVFIFISSGGFLMCKSPDAENTYEELLLMKKWKRKGYEFSLRNPEEARWTGVAMNSYYVYIFPNTLNENNFIKNINLTLDSLNYEIIRSIPEGFVYDTLVYYVIVQDTTRTYKNIINNDLVIFSKKYKGNSGVIP
ncbi:MAG: hypothetical protein ACK4LB_05615 [Spirosomataceae bacterium]